MPVARGDVVWLRSKQEELNTMLADQAAANDAQLVDVYGAPLHPNLRGMRATAAMVVEAD